MALGATSSGVAALILREQLPPVVSGIAAGALLSGWLVGFLKEYLYKMTAHDWMAWTSAIAVLVLVTMTAALVPALRASRVDPIKALRVD
jgi:ABC-type antimicrobial peptide transport system permease subunit